MSDVSKFFSSEYDEKIWSRKIMPREVDRLCRLIEEEIPFEYDKENEAIIYHSLMKHDNFECEVCKQVLPNSDIFEFHVCQHCEDGYDPELTEEQAKIAKKIEKMLLKLTNQKYDYEEEYSKQEYMKMSPSEKVEHYLRNIILLKYYDMYVTEYISTLENDEMIQAAKRASEKYSIQNIKEYSFTKLLTDGECFVKQMNIGSSIDKNIREFESKLVDLLDTDKKFTKKIFDSIKHLRDFIDKVSELFYWSCKLEYDIEILNHENLNSVIGELKKVSLYDEYAIDKINKQLDSLK